MTTSFMGKDGFAWWHGVVESRKDPLFIGRCKVRILGWHTHDKEDMPTESLPWAYPLMPITSASQSEVGYSPIGPVEGTWVMGFFRDGEAGQEPVMMGTLGGIPESGSKKMLGLMILEEMMRGIILIVLMTKGIDNLQMKELWRGCHISQRI